MISFRHTGQLGFVLGLGGAGVGVDLFLSPMRGRLVKPVLRPEDVAGLDLFIGTHDHADHIDRPLWRRLARLGCGAKFLVPAPVAADVVRDTGLARSQVVGLAQGESAEIRGVKATAVASAHERLEYDRRGRAKCLGFVLEAKGARIYHSGDCCIYEGLQSRLAGFGRFDAMFLPVNGRDAWRLTHDFIGCMDAHEAVELAGELGARVLVPGHYDMFRPNLGDVGECVAFAAAKYPKLRVLVPRTGERQVVR